MAPQALNAPTWALARLRPSLHAHVFQVGTDKALFCTRTQQLHALNDSAHLIWTLLAGEHSCETAALALEGLGIEPASARAFVHDAALSWLTQGLLTPEPVLDLLNSGPAHAARYNVCGFGFELRHFGQARLCSGDVFAPLFSACASPSFTLSVVGLGDHDFLFKDAQPIGMRRRRETAPALKAAITAELCNAPGEGFFIHAALVRVGSKRVLIAGDPGAGKSTLALALVAAGVAYGGDDIVRISEAGAQAASFAATAKAGAWPLLQGFELEKLPIWRREDGVPARYIAPAAIDGGCGPLHAILLLDRGHDAAMGFEPLAPLTVLCSLLGGAYSPRAGVDGETLLAFAKLVERASCHKLAYRDAHDAAALILELVDA